MKHKSKHLKDAPRLSETIRKQLDGNFRGKVDDERLERELKAVCREIRKRRQLYSV